MRRTVDRSAGLLAFLILVAACFQAVLLRDEQFGYRDASSYYYPLHARTTAQWKTGQIPLWDPAENGGLPLLGNPTAAVLYPGKIVFAIFPLAWASRLYLVGHVGLAFAAMAFCLRRFGVSRIGSLIGGLTYGFGGPVMLQYCNAIYLVGSAWLPLGVLATDAWIRQGRPRRTGGPGDGAGHAGAGWGYRGRLHDGPLRGVVRGLGGVSRAVPRPKLAGRGDCGRRVDRGDAVRRGVAAVVPRDRDPTPRPFVDRSGCADRDPGGTGVGHAAIGSGRVARLGSRGDRPGDRGRCGGGDRGGAALARGRADQPQLPHGRRPPHGPVRLQPGTVPGGRDGLAGVFWDRVSAGPPLAAGDPAERLAPGVGLHALPRHAAHFAGRGRHERSRGSGLENPDGGGRGGWAAPELRTLWKPSLVGCAVFPIWRACLALAA